MVIAVSACLIGENCKYPGKSKMFVKKYLMDSVDKDTLKKQMIETLFERDYTIFE